MATEFTKIYQDANGGYRYWQIKENRYVSNDQYQLVEWLAAGNIPVEVAYVAPAVIEHIEVIPDITARQLRLWLVSNDISLDAIDAQISIISDAAEKAKAQIEWEYASSYNRNHPLVAQITTAMGMTSQQVDQAFKDASQL